MKISSKLSHQKMLKQKKKEKSLKNREKCQHISNKNNKLWVRIKRLRKQMRKIKINDI